MKKIISIGLVAFALTACGTSSVVAVKCLTSSFVNKETIKERYYVNDIFTDYKTQITYKGSLIDVTSYYVTKPSGNVISSPSIVLDEAGVYDITYFGFVDGQEVFVNESMTVYQNIYSLSSDQSKAVWKNSIYQGKQKLPGFEVTLADGDRFTYNDVVDIKNSSIETPLIRFYPYNFSVDAGCLELEAAHSIVRITDYADPNNFIEVDLGLFENRPGERFPYCVAGSNGQSLTGIQQVSESALPGNASRRIVYIDDIRYRVYYGNNDFGTQMGGSPGTPLDPTDPEGASIHNGDYNGYSVYYDAATKRIFVEDDSMRLITDLDQSLIYDSNLFQGFKSDKVLISLYASNYSKTTARYSIDCIGGRYGNDLNKEYVDDRDAPVISFPGKYANGFLISTNEEFDIFEVTSYDLHPTNKPVSVQVYYEYGTAMQSNISLRNNKFIANKEGRYSIVYRAKDVYGNEAEEVINLTAVKTENNSTVNFYTKMSNEISAGELFTLNEYYLQSINNSTFIKINAIYEKTGEVTEIDPVTREFLPKHVGKYLLSYTYGDEVIEKTYNYYINAKTSNSYILGSSTLPSYFIKGCKMTLEVPKVQIFSSEKDTFVLPETYVSFDGGEYKKVDATQLKIEGNNTVSFRFDYNNETLQTTQNYTIVDVGFGVKDGLRMKDYFFGNVSKNATSDDIKISTLTNGGVIKFTFINPLSFANFNVGFYFDEAEINFASFKIIISDFYNEANIASLCFTKNGSYYYLTINDGNSYLIKNQPTITSNYIYYNDSQGAFLDSSGNTFNFANPFSNDKIMISFEIEDVDMNSTVHFTKIGNQNLSNSTRDTVVPQLLAKSIDGEYSLNDVVTLSPANACDVLSPYLDSNFSMTVTNELGYVMSDEGTLLDGTQSNRETYELTLSRYDDYLVYYKYIDNNGYIDNKDLPKPKEAKVGMNVSVSERIPPVIIIDGNYGPENIDSASVGSSVTVRGYTVTDNLSSVDEIEVMIVVFRPDLVMVDVTETKTFVVTISGTYKVYYYARDGKGNIAVNYYQIKA